MLLYGVLETRGEYKLKFVIYLIKSIHTHNLHSVRYVRLEKSLDRLRAGDWYA